MTSRASFLSLKDMFSSYLSILEHFVVFSNILGACIVFQGTLMQMTMMTPPSFNSELHYLNKEDRLLRWLLVKHRDIKPGLEYFGEKDSKLSIKVYQVMGDDKEDESDEESDTADEM